MSQPCWLTRTSGRNARSSGGTTASNARSQPASPVPAGRATLTADPSASGPPCPGAGRCREQRHRVLVQADRQHPRVVVERGLDTVAVVHVDVHVGDPLRTCLHSQPIAMAGSLLTQNPLAELASVVQAASDVDAVPASPTTWPRPRAAWPRPPAPTPRACRWVAFRIHAGQTLRLTGYWREHLKYGRQFQVFMPRR